MLVRGCAAVLGRGAEEQNGTSQAKAGIFDIDQEGVNIVRLLSQDAFRSKLIIHLNIAWAKKELKWPVKKLKVKTYINNKYLF